jgi:hypothetical protein
MNGNGPLCVVNGQRDLVASTIRRPWKARRQEITTTREAAHVEEGCE